LLLVVDINNLEGSYPSDVINKINDKELDIFIVVNKVDSI